MSSTATTKEFDWIDASGGYAVALDGGRIVARSPRGATLKSVPAALRNAPIVQQLRDVREWLARHDTACVNQVEAWMVAAVPVSMTALGAVWVDPSWRRALCNAVVIALDDDGSAGQIIPEVGAHGAPPGVAGQVRKRGDQRELTGFLRAIDSARGVGLVTLDGESTWLQVRRLRIAHPTQLRNLADFREFGAELQLEQGIRQLYREASATEGEAARRRPPPAALEYATSGVTQGVTPGAHTHITSVTPGVTSVTPDLTSVTPGITSVTPGVTSGAHTDVTSVTARHDGAENVAARTYVHPALRDRSVVRLVPDGEATAHDVVLELVGFKLAGVTPSVAARQRRALGFAAWTVANDPANARQALALVPAFERITDMAKTRPAAAGDAFEVLARELGPIAARSLPTFYEDAGRAFIAAGAPDQAAALYARARVAEHAHRVALTAEHRRDVLLEFAAAGALPSAALQDYVEGVGASTSELVPLLQALLETPSLALASAGFWKTCREPLLALARNSRQVRLTLLNLFPTPRPARPDFRDWWLGLVVATGGFRELIENVPAPGPAWWLEQAVEWARRGADAGSRSSQLIAVMKRLAPRLRADGVPVDLVGRFGWRADLGLIDAALKAGVPVALPPTGLVLGLESHGQLPHLFADPNWKPLLEHAFERLLSQGRARSDTPAVRQLLAEWLGRGVATLETGGLPQVAAFLGRLDRARPLPRTALAERIGQADLAAALGRTLRGGLVQEFVWPALEQARARLSPEPQGLLVSFAWPNVVLCDASRAVVVGPADVLLEHDLRPPPAFGGQLPSRCVFTGGQLQIVWEADGPYGYWTARPRAFGRLQLPSQDRAAPGVASLELADGSRTFGGRAIHPGDTELPSTAQMFSDGARFWRLHAGSLHGFDPVTGRANSDRLPSFYAAAERLQAEHSWLMPLRPGLEATPLGTRDGLLGWRVDGSVAEGVDGRRFDGTIQGTPVVGLVTWPGGGDHPRPLTVSGVSLSLWSPDGKVQLFNGTIAALSASNSVVLPPLFWHCLRPRDPTGSQALRSVSDAAVGELLDCALRDDDAQVATQTVVKQLLPDVSDTTLQRAIGDAVAWAARLMRQRDALELAQ